MNPRRDRIIAGAAVAVVVLLGVLVVSAVLDAQRNGRQALERLQLQQVEQLAGSLDSRLDQIAGLPYGNLPWELTPGSASDSALLQQLYDRGTVRDAGFYLVDADGTIVNGILLRSQSILGERYAEDALDELVEENRPGVSGVHPGRTTSEPVLDIIFPIGNPPGRGALIWESVVRADSAFAAEVANLRAGETGAFSYLDANGVVIASSDATLIGRELETAVDIRPGFNRDDGKVSAVATIDNADWRAVFIQDGDEFEGELTGPLRSALLLMSLAVVVLGGVVAVALVRRLRAARAEQRRLAQMNQAQEEFIGIVSHELRTPVSGLLGFLQTTLDHWDAMPDDDRRRAVGRSLANARRLQALTSDVLDSSRIEAGDFPYTFDRIDLRDEVAAAVAAAQDTRTDAPIALDVPDTPVWVRADPDRLQQVLTNLLDNALRHSPTDGAVDVRLRMDDGNAVVSVTDHGPGIASEDVERVFQKFVRGRNSAAGGTGLGLYIARQIVDAHGGRIWATSGAGSGATLTFSIPGEGPGGGNGGSPSARREDPSTAPPAARLP